MSKPIVRRSIEELDAEIAALREIRPIVPEFNAWRESNWKCIDAQIAVLDEDADATEIEDEYVREHAIQAWDWFRGRSVAPSVDWQRVVQRAALRIAAR
jgi:hypothetical protein